MSVRVAVLASGGGSNLQALLDWQSTHGGWRIELVASDRASAGALDRAVAAGVTRAVLGPDLPLEDLLRRHDIDAVLLAGFLRLVPASVVAAYRGRILNIHPALLPAFAGEGMYGIRIHRAVLAGGARVTGVTVHQVDEEYDQGRILAQWPVPVHPDDTPEALATRVLAVEHRLYPRVAHRLFTGSGAQDGSDGVGFRYPGAAFVPFGSETAPDLAELEMQMDRALGP